MSDAVRISSVKFRNYKAFREYSVALSHFNVLVGACGADGEEDDGGLVRCDFYAVGRVFTTDVERVRHGRGTFHPCPWRRVGRRRERVTEKWRGGGSWKGEDFDGVFLRELRAWWVGDRAARN
jgi:hypothetical protein